MTLELGITQDYRKAVKWYKLEAEQRYTYAQYNLSAAHGSGTRVPKDYNAPISEGSFYPGCRIRDLLKRTLMRWHLYCLKNQRLELA